MPKKKKPLRQGVGEGEHAVSESAEPIRDGRRYWMSRAAELQAELAKVREENENLREAHGPGKCVRQARPEVLLERDDALKETK